MKVLSLLVLVGVYELGWMEENGYHLTKIRNTGLLFEGTGSTQFFTNTFSVITNIQLPTYQQRLKELEGYVDQYEKLCEQRERGKNDEKLTSKEHKSQCWWKGRQERHVIMGISARDREFSHLLEHHERRKRGVLNGLGSVLKVIGGTMDNEDFNNIEARLQNLEKDQNRLIEVEKDRLYAVTSFRKTVGANMEHLFEQQNKTRIILNDLLRNYSNASERMSQKIALADLLASINMELAEIDRHVRESVDIITALQAGVLHPAIISKNALNQIYNKINEKIITGKGTTGPGRLQLSRTFKIKSKISNTNIIIVIQAPIPDQHLYQISKIYVIPMQIRWDAPYVVYKIRNPYMASSVARTKFVYMSAEEFDNCREINEYGGPKITLCELTTSEVINDSGDCVIQLLKGIRPENGTCEYRVVKRGSTFIRMTGKNRWLFSFVKPKEIRVLNAENKLFTGIINGTGIIELSRKGEIHLDNYIYRASDTKEVNVTIEIPDEWPWLQDKWNGTEEIFASGLVEGTHAMLVDSGESIERWRGRVEVLKGQQRLNWHNQIGYGTSGVVVCCMICFLAASWWFTRRCRTTINNGEEGQQKAVVIELQNIPTHRSARVLNGSNRSV